MRKIRILIAILPLLISMLLFSVGFSTWSIIAADGKGAETSFAISVEPIYKMDEFISISRPDVFDYNALHFVDDEGNQANSGSIVVSCEVYIDAYSAEMGDAWDGSNDSVEVRVDLLYTNICIYNGQSYSLFEEIEGKKEISANLLTTGPNGETESEPCSIENGGSFVYATATVKPGKNTGIFSFGIEFVFDVPMNDPDTGVPSNFRQVFGKYLKNKENDKTDFIATARVTEIN